MARAQVDDEALVEGEQTCLRREVHGSRAERYVATGDTLGRQDAAQTLERGHRQLVGDAEARHGHE